LDRVFAVNRLENGQSKNGSGGDGGEREDTYGMGLERKEDLDGLAPAQRLHKATIIGKATEYIVHLERKVRDLTKENSVLKSRGGALEERLETLVMSDSHTFLLLLCA
jgi:hypothetical protein